MKTLKTQKEIADEIASLVIRYKPDIKDNGEFYGQLFAAKAYAMRTGAGLGIKNSKKDTDDLTDFIGALNRLEGAYQKLSPRAKQQISHSSYSLSETDQLSPRQRDQFFETAAFYKELALSAKDAYKADWVVDRSDPIPYSVCRAIYWLAPKLGITITTGKAPIGVPFGDFGQECFDLTIIQKPNFEHYSRQIAKKGLTFDD
jgi:hypothetical protein